MGAESTFTSLRPRPRAPECEIESWSCDAMRTNWLLKATDGVVLCPEVIPPRLIARMEKWTCAAQAQCVYATPNADCPSLPNPLAQVGPKREPDGRWTGDRGSPALRHQGVSAPSKKDIYNGYTRFSIPRKHPLVQSFGFRLISAASTLCRRIKGKSFPPTLPCNRYLSLQACAALSAVSRIRSAHPRFASDFGYNGAGALCAEHSQPAILHLLQCLTAIPCMLVDAQQWVAGPSSDCSDRKGVTNTGKQCSDCDALPKVGQFHETCILMISHCKRLHFSGSALIPHHKLSVASAAWSDLTQPSRRQVEGTVLRSHYRPDGSRRRAAGEIVARAPRPGPRPISRSRQLRRGPHPRQQQSPSLQHGRPAQREGQWRPRVAAGPSGPAREPNHRASAASPRAHHC